MESKLTNLAPSSLAIPVHYEITFSVLSPAVSEKHLEFLDELPVGKG